MIAIETFPLTERLKMIDHIQEFLIRRLRISNNLDASRNSRDAKQLQSSEILHSPTHFAQQRPALYELRGLGKRAFYIGLWGKARKIFDRTPQRKVRAGEPLVTR